MSLKVLYFLCVLSLADVSTGYYTIFVEDSCQTSETSVIHLISAANANSSGILRATRNSIFLSHRNCTILLQPSFGYGVILSIKYFDMTPFHEDICENYITIRGEDGNSDFSLCGYSDDITEYKSYYSEGTMRIVFHTEEPKEEAHSDFTLIITSFFKSKDNYCPSHMFRCGNTRCIWQGLTCDDHNNCGDRSDENTGSPSFCNMTPNIIIISCSLAVPLLAVISVVICCRRLRKQQNSHDDERSLLSRSESYASNTSVQSPGRTITVRSITPNTSELADGSNQLDSKIIFYNVSGLDNHKSNVSGRSSPRELQSL